MFNRHSPPLQGPVRARRGWTASLLCVCMGLAGCQQIADRLTAAIVTEPSAATATRANLAAPEASAQAAPSTASTAPDLVTPAAAMSSPAPQTAPKPSSSPTPSPSPSLSQGPAAPVAAQEAKAQTPGSESARSTAQSKVQSKVPVSPSTTASDAASTTSATSTSIQDCDVCPVVVRLPAGSFQMGSPDNETGRDADEGPRTRVAVAALAMGRTEVTRSQWMAFERESGHRAESGCLTWDGDGYVMVEHLGWKNPGFAQSDDHPVVCISSLDAQAYVRWLSRKTGQLYRLPSESEWEYAARAGTTSAYPWGAAQVCEHGNGADLTLTKKNPRWPGQTCQDGFAHTAPVGSFVPNAWGLYDMHGNAMEWTQDCWRAKLSPPRRAPHR